MSSTPPAPDADPSPAGPAPTPAEQPAEPRRFPLVVIGLLMGVVIAVVLGVVVTGSDDGSGDGKDDGAAAQVQAALARDAELLAGTGEPAALAEAACQAVDGGDVACTPKGAGAAIRFVLLPGGAAGKRLAGTADPSTLRSSESIAAALAADAEARDQGKPAYRCATSLRLDAKGTPEPGTASGYLCVADTTKEGAGDQAGSRYVELNGDGIVTRDYIVSL